MANKKVQVDAGVGKITGAPRHPGQAPGVTLFKHMTVPVFMSH